MRTTWRGRQWTLNSKIQQEALLIPHSGLESRGADYLTSSISIICTDVNRFAIAHRAIAIHCCATYRSRFTLDIIGLRCVQWGSLSKIKESLAFTWAVYSYRMQIANEARIRSEVNRWASSSLLEGYMDTAMVKEWTIQDAGGRQCMTSWEILGVWTGLEEKMY